MKCDELRIEYACVYGPDAKVYLAEQVNAAIDELKDKIQQKDFFWEGCGFSKMGFKNTIDVAEYVDKLKQKIEDVQASHYAEMVDAGMRERKLKRALWLARSEKAKIIAKIYSKEAELTLLREHYPSGCGFCHMMNNKWKNVERKCRAKAEEYR